MDAGALGESALRERLMMGAYRERFDRERRAGAPKGRDRQRERQTERKRQ